MNNDLMQDGGAMLQRAFSKACKPRPRLTVSQWADKNRILSGKSSQEAGKWRTSRTPFAREIMDCLSLHSPVRKVAVQAAIQLIKTEVGLNWTGYIIDHAPAPTLSVQPTLESRDRYVLQRINPLLEVTLCLADKINVQASRKASNSRDIKDFAGGIIVFSGANSPSSLRSMPMKYVIADEVDAFDLDVGGEGDPLGLIEGRQSSFARSKILVISSPTMKEASVIEKEFLAGDRRYYHVPCPHCGEKQRLHWKQFQWTMFDGVLKEVFYVCEACSGEILEHHKTKMLADGVWIAEKPHARHRSYHISALYSPVGLGLSWQDLVYEWLEAQNDQIRLKRFVNTRLAETWEDQSRNLKWHMLADRAEDYQLKTVPDGGLVLTAGIDTQNDRLAIQVTAWGRNGDCWVIDYIELPGDPNDQVESFLKKEGAFYDYMKQAFMHASGKNMFISAAGWDSGGQRTESVYQAVRARLLPRLLAFKGSSIAGKPILAPRPKAMDVNYRGKVFKKGVGLWMIGTDTAKDAISAHLGGDADKPIDERKIHFSKGLEEDYYKMLVAEKFDPEKNRWVKPAGKRNEAIDVFVYSMAAARHPEIRVHAMSQRGWDVLERQIGAKPRHDEPADIAAKADSETSTVDATDAAASQASTPRKLRHRRQRSGSGFVGNF